jgi:hypothetical protein
MLRVDLNQLYDGVNVKVIIENDYELYIAKNYLVINGGITLIDEAGYDRFKVDSNRILWITEANDV